MFRGRIDRRSLTCVLVLLAAVSIKQAARAQVSVETVRDQKFDIPYWTVVGASSLGVAFDAYTTLVSIGPGKRCTAEIESPALYGRRPTPPRTLAVMGAQLGAAIVLSRELRRHSQGKSIRRLTLLMAAANAVHFAGAIHNERMCQ